MKNKIIIALLSVLLSSTIIASNFYKNLAEEGKKLYLAGKYEEAVENFRIAEFGLMEKKEQLKELYLYYSLAHFKLSNGDEVVELKDKLKDLTGVSSFEGFKFPEVISKDLDTMFSVIDRTYKKAVKKEAEKKNVVSKKIDPVRSEEYIEVYNNVRDSLKGNDLPAVKVGLKKLRTLGKNDIRTRYVSGIVYFRENKYKKVIKELVLVNKTGSDELKDEASYYLALSNYFLKNYGQFLAFSQKVKDKNSKGKLSDIQSKVKKIREEGLRKVKTTFFNKKIFTRFVSGFKGDISLGSDIFKEVKKMIPLRAMNVYYMANYALKYPNIYDEYFIVDLINFLVEKEMEEYAEDIAKRSRFYKKDDLESIDILYNLGLMFNKIGKKKKMKKVMLRVRKIDSDYKKVGYYLTNEK